MLKVKRVYVLPDKSDGLRILVDRLWPRGLNKSKAKIDLWLKEIAPTDGLCQWFAHDPKKWAEFKERYFQELSAKKELVQTIIDCAKKGTATLLFSAKDESHNNALALKEYLSEKAKLRTA